MERFGIIYLLSNIVNGKYYVGQTIRLLNKRMIAHQSAARNESPYLISKAIAKYGWDNFKVDVLERVKLNDLDGRERYWVAEYNSFGPGGYNMDTGGQSGGSKVNDIEANEIFEQWNLGFTINTIAYEFNRDPRTISSILEQFGVTSEDKAQHNKRYITISPRSIVQIDLISGKIIEIWESIYAASKTFEGDLCGSIGSCCAGHCNSAAKYYWRYIEDVPVEDIELGYYSGWLPEKWWAGVDRKFDWDEVQRLWNDGLSQTQIADTIGASVSGVHKILIDLGISAQDRAQRASESIVVPVVRINPDTRELQEFSSITAASLEYGVDHSSIASAIDRGGTSVNYNWKYKKDIAQEDLDSGYYSGELVDLKLLDAISRGIPVVSINPNTREIVEYISIHRAANDHDIARSSIISAIERSGLSNGYYWLYKSDVSDSDLSNRHFTGKLEDPTLKLAISRGTPVVGISPDGTVFKYFGMHEAGRAVGGNKTGIVRAIKKGTWYKKLLWKYEQDYRVELYRKALYSRLSPLSQETLQAMARGKGISVSGDLIQSIVDYAVEQWIA